MSDRTFVCTCEGEFVWACGSECDCFHHAIRDGTADRSLSPDQQAYLARPASREVLTPLGETRFWSKVRKGPDCWDWLAGQDGDGYGVFTIPAGRLERVHRLAYRLLVGPIPAGLTLDHLCRNRACVNPDHLEPVTNRVNVLRGVGPTARFAARTHCSRGHLLSRDNLRMEGTVRRCRACDKERQSERPSRSKVRANA